MDEFKLKKVIQEVINKRYINEDFQKLLILEDNEQFNFLCDIVESFNENEIITVLNEQSNKIKSLFNKEDDSDEDIGIKFKTYITTSFLKMLGFKGLLLKYVSNSLSEISVKELVGVFRGRGKCEETGDKVTTGIINGIVNFMVGGTSKNSMAEDLISTTIANEMRTNELGKNISNYLCGIANK
jgi:hypothetical protein